MIVIVLFKPVEYGKVAFEISCKRQNNVGKPAFKRFFANEGIQMSYGVVGIGIGMELELWSGG